MEVLNTKKCSKCKEDKTLDRFYKNKNRKDGHENHCKSCKQNRENYHEILNIQGENGFCKICDRVVKLSSSGRCSFSRRNTRSFDGVDKSLWTQSEMIKNQNLRHNFNIDLTQYRAMLKAQDHLCASCKTHQSEFTKEFAVDHDHLCCPGKRSCGRCIRGLLCGKCNAGIGFFDDDVEKMRLAIKYLEDNYLQN